LFIFPPFNKIILKYASSKQSDINLGEIGAADFLGTRKDNDKEHSRLYRAMARRIQRSGVGGMKPEDGFVLEVQRYHEKHSCDPGQLRKISKRRFAKTGRGFIASNVDILFWDRDEDGEIHQRVEGMLDLLDHAEEIAFKARAGEATNDDLFRMPWMHLGQRGLRQRDESDEARIERLVSCDVVLFLWVVALLVSETAAKSANMDHYIPARQEHLGMVWFQELEGFAKNLHWIEEPRSGPPAPYKTVAAFLVSGDPDGGPIETLAEELSGIVRGKKRITKRVVDRHAQLLTKALETYWDDQPDKQAMAEPFGKVSNVHGQVLGLLQYARAVALSDVQREYPTADIEAAFDAGLSCWPKLVKWARS
jgi:hypothetical protein